MLIDSSKSHYFADFFLVLSALATLCRGLIESLNLSIIHNHFTQEAKAIALNDKIITGKINFYIHHFPVFQTEMRG